MAVSLEHMSVKQTSYSQDIMGILPNGWWKLNEKFAVPGGLTAPYSSTGPWFMWDGEY
jgi:hypothetical protein